MQKVMFLLLFIVVGYANGGSNERYPRFKRQSYGSSGPQPQPTSYEQQGRGGGQQGGPLPPGVLRPLIPPTFGNDKGADHGYQDYEDGVNTLPGQPGEDYPIYGPHPPETNFNCASVPHVPGYYANVDYRCQVFHVCEDGGKLSTFICPNGTIYNQRYFVCDWWYNVNCAEATSFYGLNGNLYQVPAGGYPTGGTGTTGYGNIIPTPGAYPGSGANVPYTSSQVPAPTYAPGGGVGGGPVQQTPSYGGAAGSARVGAGSGYGSRTSGSESYRPASPSGGSYPSGRPAQTNQYGSTQYGIPQGQLPAPGY